MTAPDPAHDLAQARRTVEEMLSCGSLTDPDAAAVQAVLDDQKRARALLGGMKRNFRNDQQVIAELSASAVTPDPAPDLAQAARIVRDPDLLAAIDEAQQRAAREVLDRQGVDEPVGAVRRRVVEAVYDAVLDAAARRETAPSAPEIEALEAVRQLHTPVRHYAAAGPSRTVCAQCGPLPYPCATVAALDAARRAAPAGRPPGANGDPWPDEFEPYLAEKMQDPEFRRVYERAVTEYDADDAPTPGPAAVQCECDGPGEVTDMHRPYCPVVAGPDPRDVDPEPPVAPAPGPDPRDARIAELEAASRALLASARDSDDGGLIDAEGDEALALHELLEPEHYRRDAGGAR